MHSMHKGVLKTINPRYVLISVGYIDETLKDQLIWEQEVPSSNLGAPTSLRFWTQWKTKAAAPKPKAKAGHYYDAWSKLRLGTPALRVRIYEAKKRRLPHWGPCESWPNVL